MSKHKKGFIYARVSSEAQVEKGLSIPSQLELTRSYAREHEIERPIVSAEIAEIGSF